MSCNEPSLIAARCYDYFSGVPGGDGVWLLHGTLQHGVGSEQQGHTSMEWGHTSMEWGHTSRVIPAWSGVTPSRSTG